MANTLIKNQGEPAGGGAGSGGSGGSGGGGGTNGPGLPPQGSKCYGDLFAKVQKLWPNHQITYVKSDSGAEYLRVSDLGAYGYVWKVTGTCKNGYIEINYVVLQSPGIGTS